MSDIEELGQIGEHLVRVICSKSKICSNKYDGRKDIECGNSTIEVKTQVRFWAEDVFTVNKRHLKKCAEVDFLIFVEYGYQLENYTIKIWHCVNNTSAREIETRRGTVYGFDIKDMQLISKLEWPAVAAKMREASPSLMCERKETI